MSLIPAKVRYTMDSSVYSVSKERRMWVQGCSATDVRTSTPIPAQMPKQRDFTT